ncbi:branched-chain amino acid transport system II carrier protein [Gottschalkiaceae bacterium SANA]|nr:branched-chain amino acid transport system II carrier protein [Gottschalkiaceae bacterium SANA]
MDRLTKKDVFLVGLMLFSMFFGAGNLIFPPFLGQLAGEQTWIAMGAFAITAVGFPILGVVAVAKSGGLSQLASRVHPWFAGIFIVSIYLAIGPFLAIPRAGSLPFEMAVAPYLAEGISLTFAMGIYTIVFFALNFWLSLSPGDLVDRMGKVLTPILLILIFIMFGGAFFNPIGSYGTAIGAYKEAPFVQGFLDGYLTLDTLAALVFGVIIAVSIRAKGIKDEKAIVSGTIQAGVIAGGFLFIIYAMLAHLGAMGGSEFGFAENGAQTLTYVVTAMYGFPGAILLAVIFTLACISTSVGLTAACSQYFSEHTPLSYGVWVGVITLISMLLANMGLTKILVVSIPVLLAMYPIAIILILLGLADRVIQGHTFTYRFTVLLTGIVSFTDALGQSGIELGKFSQMMAKLPLYEKGLGWVFPAFFGMAIGLVVKAMQKK